jgi:hypothetical protein
VQNRLGNAADGFIARRTRARERRSPFGARKGASMGDGWVVARLAAQTVQRPLGASLWSELASGIDRRSFWRARWWPVRLRTAGDRGGRESPAGAGLSGRRTPAEAKVRECRGRALCRRGLGTARVPSRWAHGDHFTPAFSLATGRGESHGGWPPGGRIKPRGVGLPGGEAVVARPAQGL